MDPVTIVPLVTGAGGALVVLLLDWWNNLSGRTVPGKLHREITADKDKQIADWKAAHEAERTRADAATTALQTTNSVLSALHREVRTDEIPATTQGAGARPRRRGAAGPGGVQGAAR